MNLALLAALLGAATSPTAPLMGSDVRVALSIGHNVGLSGEEPLGYAEADARRFHELLIEVGQVERERAYLVAGGDADAVRAALLEVTGRLLELSQRGPSTLIVYVSAHADDTSLHLGGTNLPVAEIRAAMARTNADLRLLIVDGCRTAVRVKERGGRPASQVAVTFDRGVEVRGELVIRSASNGEPAQEWTYLRGGLFTHHLLVGLRGVADLDGDSRVTLAEAYGYAYRNTVTRSATTRGGAQHPSFDFDVRGFGEWTFSRPADLKAALVLGRELSGVTWIANRRNELVAEFTKAPNEAVRVALSPGWYRIVIPDGTFVRVADINLGWGGTRVLDKSDFVRTEASPSRLRGRDPIVLRPWRLAVGYAAASGSVDGLGFEHRGDLRILRAWDTGYARVGVAAGGGAFRTLSTDVAQQSLRLTFGAGYELPVGFVSARVGLELRSDFVRQVVRRDDAETIRRVFDLEEPVRYDVIVGAGVVAALSVPITDRVFVETEIEPGLLRVPNVRGAQLRFVLEARVAAVYAF